MLKVQITTAVELTDKQTLSMEKALTAKVADSNLVFEYRVDPNVLGGLRVIVGSREFDRTLRTRFEQIRQNLTAQL